MDLLWVQYWSGLGENQFHSPMNTVHGYSAEALNKRLNGIGFGMGNVLKETQSVDLEITPLE